MVLGRDDVHAHLLVGVHALEQAFGGGAGGGHHVLALEVGEVGDARGLPGQQAGAHLEDAHREIHLLLALDVVGGGAALQVDGAVLHQRDARLRGHQVVAHLQLGQRQLLLDRLDRLELQVMGETHRLLRAVAEIGEGDGGVAVAEDDGAGFLDLLQGAGQFFGQRRGAEQGGGQGDGDGAGKSAGGHADPHCCCYRLAGRVGPAAGKAHGLPAVG
ncbi:hypothetical protein D3C84_466830 [compost metagenome]